MEKEYKSEAGIFAIGMTKKEIAVLFGIALAIVALVKSNKKY